MTNDRFEPLSEVQCAEDLLAIERRRELTEHERRRLGMCLAASDALQTLRQLDQDFESLQTEQADEELIVEQCAIAARRRFVGRTRAMWLSRMQMRTALVVALVLFSSLGAAAALYRWAPTLVTARSASTQPSAEHGALRDQPKRNTRTRRNESPSAAPAACASVPTSSSAAFAGHPAATGARALRSNPQSEPNVVPAVPLPSVQKSAAAVFSAANAARRSGERQRAIALYRQLQMDYPQSDEALTSHVLLARLELNQGVPAEALRQFDAYLARGAAGSLTQEALQGRAQALSSLGRKQEEAATWRKLLQDFPDSVYAQSAREHLTQGAR